MDRKVIIIPTYNEKENIEKMIRTLRSLEGDYHVRSLTTARPTGRPLSSGRFRRSFPTLST